MFRKKASFQVVTINLKRLTCASNEWVSIKDRRVMSEWVSIKDRRVMSRHCIYH